MNTYQYYVDDPKNLYEITIDLNDNYLQWIAESCAEDYYKGNSEDCVLELTVIAQSGEHKRFKVYVEFEPMFYAEGME